MPLKITGNPVEECTFWVLQSSLMLLVKSACFLVKSRENHEKSTTFTHAVVGWKFSGQFPPVSGLATCASSASLVFPAAFSTARMPLAEVKQWRPYQIPQKRCVLWQEISMVLQGCQGWSEVGCFEMFRLWFFEEQLGISEVDQVSLLVFELQTLQQIGHRWAEPIPGCFFELQVVNRGSGTLE